MWYSELAPRILPLPSSAPAGDKPPHYIFPWTTRCQMPVRQELRTRLDHFAGHPGSESGTCFRANGELWVDSAGVVRLRTNNGEPVCIRNEAPSALSLASHCRVGIAERPRTGSDGVDYAAIP